MLTPGTYPATSSSARTSAPSASLTCSSRVAAFSAGDSSAPATVWARVRSSPVSSTSNRGSLIAAPAGVHSEPAVASSSSSRTVAADDVRAGPGLTLFLAGGLGLRLGQHPVLLLDGQRGVVVGAEVGVDDGLVLADRLRGSLGDDPAGGHHDHPVTDVPDDVHVVLDEDDRHALLAEVLDVAEQALRQRRIHPGHRLVEHDHLGVAHQRPGHLQQLALAAGEDAGEVVLLGVELEPLEQVHGLLGVLALLSTPPG